MKMRKRGAVWWYDCRIAGRRRRGSTGCTDYEEAKAAAHQLASAQQESTQEGWTLRQAVDRTIEVRWSGTRGERTATLNAEHAIVYFGAEVSLESIDTDRLDGYIQWLRQLSLSDSTINRKLAALRAVLRTAFDRQKLKALPKVPRMREFAGRIRWLTDTEERALLGLLEQWGATEAHALTVLLVDTGLRLGEALRLEWRDVDPQSAAVTVWETKADKPRTVPMTTRARMALRAQGPGRVFALTKGQYHHVWHRARAQLGLAKDRQFVPHALRHTCASRLVQRGIPLKVVQEWLGHKSITTTMRYAHLSPTNLQEAVAVLEQPLKPNLRRVK